MRRCQPSGEQSWMRSLDLLVTPQLPFAVVDALSSFRTRHGIAPASEIAVAVATHRLRGLAWIAFARQPVAMIPATTYASRCPRLVNSRSARLRNRSDLIPSTWPCRIKDLGHG